MVDLKVGTEDYDRHWETDSSKLSENGCGGGCTYNGKKNDVIRKSSSKKCVVLGDSVDVTRGTQMADGDCCDGFGAHRGKDLKNAYAKRTYSGQTRAPMVDVATSDDDFETHFPAPGGIISGYGEAAEGGGASAQARGDSCVCAMGPALSWMHDSLRAMEMKMERTDDFVRGVALRLRGQGALIQKLERRMHLLEQKESAAPLPASLSAPPSAPPPAPPPTPAPAPPLMPWVPAGPAHAHAGGGGGGGGAWGREREQMRGPRRTASCPRAWRQPSPSPSAPPPPPPRRQQSVRSVSCAASAASAPHPPACFAERLAALGKNLLAEALEGNARSVRRLLDAGADPNFVGAGRWTALHRAAIKSHAEVMELLLSRGANVNVRNCHGSTPLHIAADSEVMGRCVELLVRKGADLSIRNRFGRSPLHYAAERGNLQVVFTLAAAGASISAKDDKGRTPLDLAKTARVRRLLRSCSRLRREGKLHPRPATDLAPSP